MELLYVFLNPQMGPRGGRERQRREPPQRLWLCLLEEAGAGCAQRSREGQGPGAASVRSALVSGCWGGALLGYPAWKARVDDSSCPHGPLSCVILWHISLPWGPRTGPEKGPGWAQWKRLALHPADLTIETRR